MNKNKVKRYGIRSVYLVLPQISTILINLATLPVILSSIDKSVFGKMHFVLAISAWMGAFTFSRISTESKIELAKGKYGNFLYSIITRLQLSLPVVLVGVITGVVLFIIKGQFYGYIFLFSLLNITVNNILNTSINNLLVARQKFGFNALYIFFFAGISKIISTVVVYFTKNAIYMFVAQVFSSLVFNVLALGIVSFFIPVIKDYFVKKNYNTDLKSYGIKMIFSNIATITRDNIFKILVGLYLGYEQLGVFSVAYTNLFTRVKKMTSQISPLLYSKEAINKGVTGKLVNIRSNVYIVLFSIVSMIVVFFIGAGYIQFFLPIEYKSAILVYMILMFALPFNIYLILFVLHFSIKMDSKKLTIISIGRTFFELLSGLILGYIFNLNGIALGITIGSIITFIISKSLFSKSIKAV